MDEVIGDLRAPVIVVRVRVYIDFSALLLQNRLAPLVNKLDLLPSQQTQDCTHRYVLSLDELAYVELYIQAGLRLPQQFLEASTARGKTSATFHHEYALLLDGFWDTEFFYHLIGHRFLLLCSFLTGINLVVLAFATSAIVVSRHMWLYEKDRCEHSSLQGESGDWFHEETADEVKAFEKTSKVAKIV